MFPIQLTEEQSVNSAFMICETGIITAARMGMWTTKHIIRESIKLGKKEAEKAAKESLKLIEEGCSLFRGGVVDNSNTSASNKAALTELMNDLGGTEMNREFFFLGGDSDLSYFWKKADPKNSTILLREYIESIDDSVLKQKVFTTMQKARLDGILSYDGKAFALTNKGKEHIYMTNFVSHRLQAEENFLRKAKEALKIEGLENTYKGEKFYIFNKNGEAREMLIDTMVKDGEGINWVLFNSPNGTDKLWLREDAIDTIAFKDKEKGAEVFKELSENSSLEIKYHTEVIENQDNIKNEVEAIEKAKIEHHFDNGFEETNDGYNISVGKDGYDKLKVPKEDVEKLDDGSIKIKLSRDKEYEVVTGGQDKAYKVEKVDAEGASKLLGKESKVSQGAKEAAAQNAENIPEAQQQPLSHIPEPEIEPPVTTLANEQEMANIAGKPIFANKVEKATQKSAEVAAKAAEKTAKAAEKTAETVEKTVEKTVDTVKKTGEAVAKTAEAAVNTANAVANTAVDVADTALTAAPPAKAVSATVNTIYKTVQATEKVAKAAVKTTAKTVEAVTKTSVQSQKL